MCQDTAFQLEFQWSYINVLWSRIWPWTFKVRNSKNIELIFFRYELFSLSSVRTMKQGEFKFPSVRCFWVVSTEISVRTNTKVGFFSRPHIFKTAKAILLRLENTHLLALARLGKYIAFQMELPRDNYKQLKNGVWAKNWNLTITVAVMQATIVIPTGLIPSHFVWFMELTLSGFSCLPVIGTMVSFFLIWALSTLIIWKMIGHLGSFCPLHLSGILPSWL